MPEKSVARPTYAPVIGYSIYISLTEIFFGGLERSAEKGEKKDEPSILIPRCHGFLGFFHHDYALMDEYFCSERSFDTSRINTSSLVAVKQSK